MKSILKRGLALLLAVTVTSGSFSGLTLKAEAEEAKVETVSGNAAAGEMEETEKNTEEVSVYEGSIEIDASGLPDNEELFTAYVESLFYDNEIAIYGNVGAERLKDSEKAAYGELKTAISKIAAGEESSTAITLTESITWSAEELGVEEITDANWQKLAGEGLGKIIHYLLMDCPYDFYWYDKTQGAQMNFGYAKDTNSLTLANIVLKFSVATEFKADGTEDFDTSYAKTAIAAKEIAQAIVAKYESSTDYEKLLGFKNEICALVSYNDEAAKDENTAYGNPWQMIWVFDGDGTTEVVCEGYSKAFQYLCDLAGLTCYTVTGTMVANGEAGAHMWNIVTLNGNNYLVDVTNCDEGAIGAPNQLFLAGTNEGSYVDGYTFDLSGGVTYVYDSDQVSLLGADTLTLAGTSYDPNAVPDVEPEEPVDPDDGTVSGPNVDIGEIPVPGIDLYYEEGEVTGLYVTNNYHGWGNIQFGFVIEEQAVIEEHSFSVYVDGAGDDGSRVVDFAEVLNAMLERDAFESGTYYLTARFCTWDEEYNVTCSDDVILDTYPIYYTETVSEDTANVKMGTLTGTWYFSDYPSDWYEKAILKLYAYDEENEGNDYAMHSLSKDESCYYLNATEYGAERYDSWTDKELKLGNKNATDEELYVNCLTVNSFSKGSYEETKPAAPGVEVICDDGELRFTITNMHTEDGQIRYGLVPEGNLTDENYMNNSIEIWSEESENIGSYDLLQKEIMSGTYYFAAYYEDRINGEMAVLSSYPIVYEESVMTSPAVIGTGAYTGDIYFPQFTTDEYRMLNVFVQPAEWDEETSLGVSSKMGMYCVTKEDAEWITENYGEWEYSKLVGKSIEATETQCVITNTTAENFEYGTYTESRAQKPEITLRRDSDGIPVGFNLTNESDKQIELQFGLLAEGDTKLGNTWGWSLNPYEYNEFDFSYLQEILYTEAGVYKIAAYTCGNDMAIESELAVIDYPITIVNSDVENPVKIGISEENGNCYFTDFSIKDESYARVFFYDEEGRLAWTEEPGEKNGYYYISQDVDWRFNNWQDIESFVYEEWTFAEEQGTVYRNIAKEFESYDFTEPKATAPTVSAYRDGNGNIIGVKVINNLDHDDGALNIRLRSSEEDFVIEVYSLPEPGEEEIYLFEDMNFYYQDGMESATELTCKIYDWETELWSDHVVVEGCTVKVSNSNYDGKALDFYVEPCNDDEERRLFLASNLLPKNIIMDEFALYEDADDDWGYSGRFYLTEDESQWWNFLSVDRADKLLSAKTLEDMRVLLRYYAFNNDENGIKLSYTTAQKDKMNFSERVESEKEVTFIDYDYYQAFIASGGTVTVDNFGEIEISNDKFTTPIKWIVEELTKTFTGTDIYKWVRNIRKSIIKSSNEYWDGYSATGFYSMDNKEISNESVSKHSIVLIKYEPEIVWVDSMELKAPERIIIGKTATVKAIPDAGQDKYPFREKPEIRFESSDSSIAEIDEVTGKITGISEGVVTITAYADEELRAEENIDEIVTAQIDIEIKHECVSEYRTECATPYEDGAIIGTCIMCGEELSREVIHQVLGMSLSETSYIYDRTEKTPDVTVRNTKGRMLQEGVDYTVSYEEGRVDGGNYEVTVELCGNYSGVLCEKFEISAKKVSSSMISSIEAQNYCGYALEPQIWVEDDGCILEEGRDYNVIYKNNVKAGTATVTVNGDGANYTGNATVTFKINPVGIEEAFVSAIANQTYTGKALKPKVTVKNGSRTLVNGTDYTVSYSNNTNPGKAIVKVTGKGNYQGNIEETFIIIPKKSTLKSATSTKIGELTVKWAMDTKVSGYILECSTNSRFTDNTTETITVSKNSTVSKTISGLEEGRTYYVRVAGYKTIDGEQQLGKYSSIGNAKVKAGFTVTEISDKVYTGNALKPTVKVKSGNTTLRNGTDYTVSYTNNTNPGKATVKVTGKGNYAGTVTVTFKIVPKKATLKTVTSTATKTLTAKWTKDSKVSGYVLQYSTSRSFTGSTTKTLYISGSSNVSKQITGLTKGKTYYVRVAGYKTIDGTKQLGSYSTLKSVKVK